MIDKSNVKRADFTKNLIDQVIIKVDFSGAIIDLSDIIKGIRSHLSTSGYNYIVKGRIGQGQINVNFDPDKLPDVNVSSIDSDNYVFKHDNGKFEIHVNEHHMFFYAKLNKEMIHFDTYAKPIFQTLNLIRIFNGDYLPISRIGLRKINIVIADDDKFGYTKFEDGVFPKSVLDKYFENRVIGKFEDKYLSDNGNVNFTRLTDKGIELIENIEYERVRYVIDIDSYLEKSVNNLSKLNEMSKFDFYKNIENTFTELNNLCYDFFIACCRLDYIYELIHKL